MSPSISRSRQRLFAVLVSALAVSLLTAQAVFGFGPSSDAGSEGLDRAIAAQERHTADLMEMEGVVGTAVGVGSGSPVIKVFTSGRTSGLLPLTLDGFTVVPERVGTIYSQQDPCGGPPWQRPPECSGGADPTDRFPRPVPIGVSTGHPDITAGTIGARVVKGGNYFALSNNHVYANENLASAGDDVLQPGTYDGGGAGDEIGTLAEWVDIKFDGSANRVDAAIAATTTALVGNATPAGGYGTPSSTTASAAVNMEVIKYGRTTGETKGKVDSINASVNVQYDGGVALFTGQVIFKGQGGAFSQPGDSGSLIVSATGFNPVALLFAGNNSVTVGNPIDEVLAAFGVAIDGAGGPTPTTTTTTTTSTTTTSTTTSTTTTTVPAGEIVVVSISPNLVTSGSYSVPGRIDGLGFQPGLTVTFSGGNGPTPQAESPVVSEDRKVITFTLVMKDGGPPKPRVWTVTVQNPDGGFDTTSFTVDP